VRRARGIITQPRHTQQGVLARSLTRAFSGEGGRARCVANCQARVPSPRVQPAYSPSPLSSPALSGVSPHALSPRSVTSSSSHGSSPFPPPQVPFLQKQLAKCSQQLEDLARKEAETRRGVAGCREALRARCVNLGIAGGSDVRAELRGLPVGLAPLFQVRV
jgi:hypothetical protein